MARVPSRPPEDVNAFYIDSKALILLYYFANIVQEANLMQAAKLLEPTKTWSVD
jgi:hypothetical protein